MLSYAAPLSAERLSGGFILAFFFKFSGQLATQFGTACGTEVMVLRFTQA
jgi:hypothetical protein